MDLELLGAEERDSLYEKVEKELFEDRIIYLNEDISAYTIANIVPLIHKINKDDEKAGIEPKDRKPLHIFITSYGGSAYDGWGVVSAIENSKTPIYGYCESYAMSMALPIFLACHKRFMGKYATLLYHELRGGANGTRQEVKRLDKEYDRLQKVYDDYIVSKTTVTQEILEDHQERISDWYIDAKTAAQYSMFDELI